MNELKSDKYKNRSFVIFNVSELNLVNFDEVLQTNADTVRRSLDGTKTFIKWDGTNIPDFINDLTTKEGPYTYDEMKDILYTSEWSNTGVMPN